MRLSRELDALEVLGLDPAVVFVPKAVALVIVSPLFCFVIFFRLVGGGRQQHLGKSLVDFVAIFSDVRSATYIKILIKALLIAFCMATVAGTFGFWPKREQVRNLVGSLTALV
jgi:ABC-type transporter Mla maintaining outer membrane lipid asymmetry permease subunit MlaE